MWASKAIRQGVLPVGSAVGLAWFTDEFYGHRVMQRTLRALGTGAMMIWEYKLRWTPETSSAVHARVARRLVACLKQNEGLYVKFGQALASMDVILPEEYKTELRVLHDQAATFPFRDVRRVVEAEMGRPLAEVFAEFEEEPVASASIAQVHRAKLRKQGSAAEGSSSEDDKLTVAVKVQKPNIPVQNGFDLAMYRLVLEVFDWAFEIPLAWTYGYTRKQLEAELDFRVEAANARRCARELEASPRLRGRVVVPRVHAELSGRRVLVMEWIDCIAPASDGPALRRAGLEPADVMLTATEVFGFQIFSTGHVHCDPHPGNLLVRRKPEGPAAAWQLVLLDHGLYCEMPEQLRRDYADFWVATALGNHEAMIRLCRGWGVTDPEASELLASLVQFRRVRISASRWSAVAGLFGQQSPAAGPGAAPPAAAQPRAKPTPKEMAEAQARLKARAQKVLGDTRAFPQELLFVGRNMNMIRSANFALGRVVNRVAILAECAAEGSSVVGRPLAAGDRMARWLALCRFHATVRSFLALDQLFRLYSGVCLRLMQLKQSLGQAWMGCAPNFQRERLLASVA
mmetsp:Transcript_50158/g.160529  ORF Transcript_50158/g.160529 Transcript_50158/m.160529 type:complete len:572 (+) Transcript_50158:62-1777(+)